MKIGIDIDNVISDLDKTFLEEFLKEDKNKNSVFSEVILGSGIGLIILG